MVRAVLAWLLIGFAITPAQGQTGRLFDSIEGLVASADIMCFGRIVRYEPISDRRDGPVRVSFEVTEDIRGGLGKTLDIEVMRSGSSHDLKVMRDLGRELILTIGASEHWYFGFSVVGMKANGIMRSGGFAYFRYIDNPPKVDEEHYVSAYLADNGKIFDIKLDAISGRKNIIGRAKAFHKRYPKPLPIISIRLPNDYLRKVGDPNAYASVQVPICKESRDTILRILRNPDFVLSSVRKEMYDWERRSLLMLTIRQLEFFRDKETEAIVERFAREGDPKANSRAADGKDDVRSEAQRLLDKWAGKSGED